MPVAPRIVNDVSSVMWLNHDIHFAWQAQYLVRLLRYVTLQSYYYQDGFLQQQDTGYPSAGRNPPCRWTQPCSPLTERIHAFSCFQ